MRPNDGPGEDVPEHDRLVKTVEDERHQSGDDHHDGQVLQKRDGMHGSEMSPGGGTVSPRLPDRMALAPYFFFRPKYQKLAQITMISTQRIV